MGTAVEDGEMTLNLQPITYREACEFIKQFHSHHIPPQGWLFGIAANDGEKVVGVVTIGRPVARMLNDGYTAEVSRCCTDKTEHVASKLYAAAWRAVRAMGYRRLVTYTLASEAGTSLKAAGWKALYQTKGGTWNRPNTGRIRVDKHPTGQKTLWEAKVGEP